MTQRRTPDDLVLLARELGFRADAIEWVPQALAVLTRIAANPFLRTRVALKGGAAINLFLSRAPRLSVDIDLNYLGPAERSEAEPDWSRVHDALEAELRDAGVFRAGPASEKDALWKRNGLYRDMSGRRRPLKVELQHQHRVPLWPPSPRDSLEFGGHEARGIPVLDVHQLCAGKVVALLDRGHPRDVFDVPRLLARPELDQKRLRNAVVVLSAGTHHSDLRSMTSAVPPLTAAEMEQQLRPLLPLSTALTDREWQAYSHRLLSECEESLALVLPLAEDERDFLSRLLDQGKVEPEALHADDDFRERVRKHPAVRWRALNRLSQRKPRRRRAPPN